ncbi:esterase family protein [Nocardia sp. NPDC004168]|uniref:alpha/beta hydrolase n=1 Tax=Nocardia sp. NPDC004168 TaxID=3154452 RepID=UPI0033A04741
MRINRPEHPGPRPGPWVQILLPADRGRARRTLYMLDGRGVPENASSWTQHGHAVEFFADKDLNVVLTTGGPTNLYTDWQRRDPVLTPGLYSVVAAHSGCYTVASGAGQAQARAIVKTYGGDPDNMFGTLADLDWRAHDVLTHAQALRGTRIYLSSGSGIPGERDVPGQVELPVAITIGGSLETGAHECARAFATRLTQLQVPATLNLRPAGTHSWPYWTDELSRPWPTNTKALCTR